MNQDDENIELNRKKAENKRNISIQGYPLYPTNDDIYNKSKQERNIDPQDTSKVKTTNEADNDETGNQMDIDDVISGEDLDVPGSELDDEQENIGNEDEENNYYSLGGDDHNDLEEDQGE
jgi:hypothetical protein